MAAETEIIGGITLTPGDLQVIVGIFLIIIYGFIAWNYGWTPFEHKKKHGEYNREDSLNTEDNAPALIAPNYFHHPNPVPISLITQDGTLYFMDEDDKPINIFKFKGKNKNVFIPDPLSQLYFSFIDENGIKQPWGDLDFNDDERKKFEEKIAWLQDELALKSIEFERLSIPKEERSDMTANEYKRLSDKFAKFVVHSDRRGGDSGNRGD